MFLISKLQPLGLLWMERHLVKWHPRVTEHFICISLKHIRVVKEKIKLIEWSSGNGRVWTNCWQFWNLSNDNGVHWITSSLIHHWSTSGGAKKIKLVELQKWTCFNPLLTKLSKAWVYTHTHMYVWYKRLVLFSIPKLAAVLHKVRSIVSLEAGSHWTPHLEGSKGRLTSSVYHSAMVVLSAGYWTIAVTTDNW